MSQRTLRQWAGMAPPQALEPAQTALVLIDIQKEYTGEKLGLPAWQEAVRQGARLLEWARANGVKVLHVTHEAAAATSPLFAPGSDAVAIIPEVAPLEGETVLVKRLPSSFVGTQLQHYLEENNTRTLVLCGFMTHMCVDSTARDALHRGYRVIVAADACGSRDLPDPVTGTTIGHETVHRATLAALNDRFADVLTTARILELPLQGR